MPRAGLHILLLTIVASLALPNWLLIVLIIPPLMLVSFLNVIPPVWTAGSADLRIFDLILFVVAGKTMLAVLLRRKFIPVHPVHVAALLLILVFLVTTLIANFKFGDRLFLDEVVALLRFAAQTSVLFLLPFCFHERQVRSAQVVIDSLGYVIAGSVFATTIVFSFGVRFGEIYTTGESMRAFGLLGDQVGFVLLFFVVRQWIMGHLLRSLILVGAVFSTGTRGALLSLAIAFIVLWWNSAELRQHSKSMIWATLTLILVTGAFVTLDIGSTRSRNIIERGTSVNTFHQRLQTGGVAIETFIDNPLFGVGYSGFRFLARNYGADTAFSQFWSPVFVATAGNQYLQVLTDGGILALIAFLTFLVVSLRAFKRAMHLTPVRQNKEFMGAGYVWLLTLALGNQSAAWMLPGSLISYLLWVILAMAVTLEWKTSNADNICRYEYSTPSIGTSPA